MALRGIQEYIARDANNIARVKDWGNIVSIEGGASCPVSLYYEGWGVISCVYTVTGWGVMSCVCIL